MKLRRINDTEIFLLEEARIKGEIFRKEVMLVVNQLRQMDKEDRVESSVHKDMEVHKWPGPEETTKKYVQGTSGWR